MSKFRPIPPNPNYPPYHKGQYLEEYFYDYYLRNKDKFDKIGYELIPVFWTNYYLSNASRPELQNYLNSLDKNKKYFTVSQHDDAIEEVLPPNTINFIAGGNKNGVPIPLICSPLAKFNFQSKNILASFVGSSTHVVRQALVNTYKNDSDFCIRSKLWTPAVPVSDLNSFIDITIRSKFCLCPRGYGATSFRLYESFQLNSVPVYIYDREWLPFSNKIDWNRLAVLIDFNKVPLNQIKPILLSINDIKYMDMLEYGRHIYQQYFTMEGMSNGILEHLGDIK